MWATFIRKGKGCFFNYRSNRKHKNQLYWLNCSNYWRRNTDASEYIFDNLLKFTSNKSVYDTECRLTYVLKDEYYINLDLQNIRLFDGKPVMTGSETTSINKKANIENKLAITIDINNRYSHNFNKENREIGKESVDQIVLYTNNIVNNLGSIVKGDVEIED